MTFQNATLPPGLLENGGHNSKDNTVLASHILKVSCSVFDCGTIQSREENGGKVYSGNRKFY